MADSFHVRFNINIPIEEAQRRFRNRIENRVLKLAREFDSAGRANATNALDPAMIDVETFLGEQHDQYVSSPNGFIARWRVLVDADFSRCLQSVEGFYIALSTYGERGTEKLNRAVTETLQESEIDLGISWQDGFFTRKGAKLLDEKIVNEPLQWLADPKYQNVLIPFKKGLSHLLEGTTDSHRLADAVTDMYEALEAMAKIVTGKPSKDLSALREEFAARLRLPAAYKTMLKEYIDYGCDFRHAVETGQQRTWPLEHEAETFVYLTGLFIRLAIQSGRTGS